MVFPALFLLAALALGDAGATSMLDALQTVPYSGKSVVTRRLDGTSNSVKELVATALEGNKLLEIYGKEKKVVGDTPSNFYEMADHVQHENAFKTLYRHLEHLEKYDDAAKDHAVLLLMEKEYGMPAVSRYVSKALTANPDSAGVQRLNSAIFNRWKKEKVTLQQIAEKVTPKDFEVTTETLEDFPRAMLVRYARLEGNSEANAEMLASAALIEHFKAKVDTEETLNAVLPNLKEIQSLSTSNLAAVFGVDKDGPANIFDQLNGFAFLLFDRLRTSQDPFETFGRVQSLYGKDGRLESFAKKFWPTTKDVDISSKMDKFVEKVLPTTFAGKIRYFFRRMWFKLISIFKKKSTPAVVSNQEIPKSEIPETTVTDVVDDTSNILKTPVNDDIAATSEIPSSAGRSTVRNAADNTGGDASTVSRTPAADSAKVLPDVSKKAGIEITEPTILSSVDGEITWLRQVEEIHINKVAESETELEAVRSTYDAAKNNLEAMKGMIEQALERSEFSMALSSKDFATIDVLSAYEEALNKYGSGLKEHGQHIGAQMRSLELSLNNLQDLVRNLKTMDEVGKVPETGPAISNINSVKRQKQIQVEKTLGDLNSKLESVKKSYAKVKSDEVELSTQKEKLLTSRMVSFVKLMKTKASDHFNDEPIIKAQVEGTATTDAGLDLIRTAEGGGGLNSFVGANDPKQPDSSNLKSLKRSGAGYLRDGISYTNELPPVPGYSSNSFVKGPHKRHLREDTVESIPSTSIDVTSAATPTRNFAPRQS